MTIEAQLYQAGEMLDWTADAAYSAGAVVQLRDGRAGVVSTDVASGAVVGVHTKGVFTVQKTATMVMLKGSQLHWDHSANKAHLLHVNDRDFYLGTVEVAAASADTTVKVALNEKPVYTVGFDSGYVSVPVSSAGWTNVQGCGGGFVTGSFDLAIEAQKVDALSLRGMAVESLSYVDVLVCINTNGDDAAFDLNVGIANGTHATDADSITESLFVHVDGASLNILLESDDGTTEVAATDTTVDAVAGTTFLVQFDVSDTADIQAYVNGVNVLPNSVFKLNAATGPLKALFHMEKSSNDSPGNVTAFVGARTAQV